MLSIIKMGGMASVQPKKTGKATVDMNYNQNCMRQKSGQNITPDKRK
jgi:hypothetical protein